MAANIPVTSKLHSEYAVGWVCALPKEQTAATAMLDERHADLPKPPNDHNTYTLGSIGKHNIVIACLPKGQIGNSPSAAVAARMVQTFPSLKFCLMVGIGGGVPPKVRLGDVVVSTPTGQFPGTIQWDFGKAKQGGNFVRTGSLNNPPTALLTALTKLETDHELLGTKIPDYLDELKEKWPRLVSRYLQSKSLEDMLFKSGYNHVETHVESVFDSDARSELEENDSCRFCDRNMAIKRKPRDMRVHYGLIASGNQVIEDAKFRDKLNKDLGGQLLCIEMEAAGLMNNFPCIVIKGICDYADSHENKNWQEHAAAVAAAYAKELLGYVSPCEVDSERPMREMVEQISDCVQTIRTTFDRREDLEILNWLTEVNHGSHQTDNLTKHQPGTGQWLLESSHYKTWLDTENTTLFCPGIPGSGKTIMTSIVIDDLTSRFSRGSMVGIAYLYCNYKRKNEQNLDDLLAGLLKQLTGNLFPLPEEVKELYERHESSRTRPSTSELARVLQSVIASYSKVFFVIDALDEFQTSEDSRMIFLSQLFDFQKKYTVNIFASSRFIPGIVETFEDALILEIRAHNEDVLRYLETRILLSTSRLMRTYQEEIKSEIISAVDGMFLLAQLYFDGIETKKTPRAVKEALRLLPTGPSAYNKAYQNVMARIEEQDTDSYNLAVAVLSWIICAKRPLTHAELEHALAIEVGASTLDKENIPQLEDMVSVCTGLVVVDEDSGILRLVHYTAQEYFERTWEEWCPDAQIEITRRLVTYLTFEDFDSSNSLTEHDLENRFRSAVLYSYATRYWGYHAAISSSAAENLISDLLQNIFHVSACSQALLHLIRGRFFAETQFTALHLISYFGLSAYIPLLVGEQFDVDPKDAFGRTPLIWAAENGYYLVVKLLLERNADKNFKDEYGRTPLSLAAGIGHSLVVKLLLEKEADKESRDEYDRTPLSWAAGNGHEAIVRILLENNAPIESKDIDERTPLSWASENGHDLVVKLLLENNAHTETEDISDRTPLSWAVANNHEKVVKWLLEKNANLEAIDESGRTSLQMAVHCGHVSIVRLLLQKDPVTNCVNKIGQIPLHTAAIRGFEPIVSLLLEKDGNIESTTKYSEYSNSASYLYFGQTPLSLAAREGNESVVNLLLQRLTKGESQSSCGRSPLSFPAEKDPVTNCVNKNEQIPLHTAAIRGFVPIVSLMLEKDGNIKSTTKCSEYSESTLYLLKRNYFGQTALSLAAKEGNESVVNLLLQRNANVESQSSCGRSPLSFAAENGHESVVRQLLERNAYVENRDEYGNTPILLATANNHGSVVKLLLEKKDQQQV